MKEYALYFYGCEEYGEGKTWQFITGFKTKEEAIEQKEAMKKKGWWSEKDEDYKIILE